MEALLSCKQKTLSKYKLDARNLQLTNKIMLNVFASSNGRLRRRSKIEKGKTMDEQLCAKPTNQLNS